MKKDSTNFIIDDAMIDVNNEIDLIQVSKMTKKMVKQSMHLDQISRQEIRFIVDQFYQMQEFRKGITEQIRSLKTGADKGKTDDKVGSSEGILKYLLTIFSIAEESISNAMEVVVNSSPTGRWLINTVGIGPVLAAGLLAYFDVNDRQYATQFISYAGLNDNNRPWLGKEKSKAIINNIVGDSKVVTDDMVLEISKQTQWTYSYLLAKAYNEEKGKWDKESLIKACSIPPYNKKAKTLMWKVGESFHWQKNNHNSKYGRLLAERMIYEMERNDNGEYADQAAEILATKKIGKDTEAYKHYAQGKLPPAHIRARASRWVEKIFLSHLFEEMYRTTYDKIPPRYYSLEHCEGHHKEIDPEVPYDLTSDPRDHATVKFEPNQESLYYDLDTPRFKEFIIRIKNSILGLDADGNPKKKRGKQKEA